ncbi:MAG: sigma factor-like helix-turn-helix DNA-binding protein [Candidatus Odinarchaeia archaeon]
MKEEQYEKIINKMDEIIKLLALNLVKEEKFQKNKIIELSKLDFKPSEIAQLLGTTPNTVRVTLHEARKESLI